MRCVLSNTYGAPSEDHEQQPLYEPSELRFNDLHTPALLGGSKVFRVLLLVKQPLEKNW